MVLGVIDAAVSGGVAQFTDIFFSQSFVESNPDYVEYIPKLRKQLRNQSDILEEALQIHKKIVPQKMALLHQKLESMIILNFVVNIWQLSLRNGSEML
jgi:hypothetical protein